MANWLSQFKLGRPGYEMAFDFNPAAIQIDEQGLVARKRNLAGDMKKSALKTSIPVIRINSNYLTLAQVATIKSFAQMWDTFISFQTRNGDWTQSLEYGIPTDTRHVTLQNTSATKLSAALVAAGFSSQI